jgi:hypothetical protein
MRKLLSFPFTEAALLVVAQSRTVGRQVDLRAFSRRPY